MVALPAVNELLTAMVVFGAPGADTDIPKTALGAPWAFTPMFEFAPVRAVFRPVALAFCELKRIP